jgi:hypothetical protein
MRIEGDLVQTRIMLREATARPPRATRPHPMVRIYCRPGSGERGGA